jgi:hypothetical protein
MSEPAFHNLLINREYRLLEHVADGPRGSVFRAERIDPLHGPRTIGLRLMPGDHPQLPAWRERWAALSHLQHAYLQTVHTMGQVRGGLYADYVFCAWDYGEPWPPARTDVVRLARHLLSGLEGLHDLDLTHRAVRPSNVLLVEGRWCLADTQPDVAPAALLRRAEEEGDLSWLAPEVLAGEYGPAADMWSLGAVLRHALDPVLSPSSLTVQVAARLDGSVPRSASAPPPLDLLLHGLLHPDPDRRYTVEQALALLDGAPVPARAATPPRKAVRPDVVKRGAGQKWGQWVAPATALAWLADASLAVGGADGSVSLVATGAGRPRVSVQGHAGPVTALQWTDRGGQSGGVDGCLVQWNGDLELTHRIELGVPILAFGADDEVLTETGQIYRITGVQAVCIASVGRGLAASHGPHGWTVGTLAGVVGSLSLSAAVLAVAPDVAAACDGTLRVDGDVLSLGAPVRCVVRTDLGVVCGLQDGALVWLTQGQRWRLEGHTGAVRAMAARGGRLVTGAMDRQVLVWNLAALRPGVT